MALACLDGRERLVVVGAGMAGLKLVEDVCELCPGRYDITMICQEGRAAYNRVLLSSLLAGDAQEQDIELRPAAWYAEKNVELLTGVACTANPPRRARDRALERRLRHLRPAGVGHRLGLRAPAHSGP